MSNNRDKILTQYGNGAKEEARCGISRSSSLEFYYTKKHLDGYIQKDSRVLEVGCATGYYGMYYADRCSEYIGIDICPPHIDIFRRKIAESGIKNVSCAVGDATALSGIADGSFDVVLCLGPMYHLPAAERELAFSECARACRTGGILAFAYINKIGVYAGACILDGKTYPNELANTNVLSRGTDDMRPGTFYYTTPEEMNSTAINHGLIVLKNLGTDFFVTMKAVDSMTDEQFELMKPLYDSMTAYESCTGMSNHALQLCKKN